MKQTFQTLIWLVLLQCIFTSTVYADADSDSKGVVQAYQNWCAAIAEAKGNPATVVKFYAPNAILLPTLSSEILFNKKDGGKNEYFTELTGKHDIRCVPGKLITRMYGNEAQGVLMSLRKFLLTKKIPELTAATQNNFKAQFR